MPAVGSGHYTLEYGSIDAVGNREATKTLEFDVYDDTTPPTTTVTAPAGWVLPPAHVSLGATDDLSGSLRRSTRPTARIPQSPTAVSSPSPQMASTPYASAPVDAVGNEETPKSTEVWVDGAPPSTSAIVERSAARQDHARRV